MTELIDWFVHYLKQKDLHFKVIKSVVLDSDSSILVEKSKMGSVTLEWGFVNLGIGDLDLEKLIEKFNEVQKDGKVISYLVLFNTPSLVKQISLLWKKLVSFKRLKIFFVNPYSIVKIWGFCPFSHDLIGGTSKGFKVLSSEVSSFSSKDYNKFKLEKFESN